MPKPGKERTIAVNKPAHFHYDILETFEAGLALVGSEVKSVKEGRISLKESFAEIRNGEVFLIGSHISPYEPANRFNHDPLRPKKLLLHKREIKRLTGKIKEKGLTLVPLKVIANDKSGRFAAQAGNAIAELRQRGAPPGTPGAPPAR